LARRHSAVAIAAAASLVALPAAAAMPVPDHEPPGPVKILAFVYRAHNGVKRLAFLVLPRWYGPRHDPPIPLVISPHGRGADEVENTAPWGSLPERGRFALISPEGQGRRLALFSWGDPGQIADLARMPWLARRAFPWLRFERRRIYAVGESMGGQETLLLVARYPHLLAGAAAFDAPTDMALRYRDFRELRRGLRLQRLARFEIGGPPRLEPRLYAERSPLAFARRIALSGVPLELWWSRADRVVIDQAAQSGLLYRRIKRFRPHAPVRRFVGRWAHGAEFRRDLPRALEGLGLLV
jgi:pimeloyl-ACP methyl ester carboxylesterase